MDRRKALISAGSSAIALWASSDPAMLYPAYQDLWHLNIVATTALFAIYPIALMLGLVLAGGLSDLLGRDRVVTLGLSIVLAASVVAVVAPAPVFIYIARAAQGAGVSLVVPAAGAMMLEALGVSRVGLASAMNAAAAALGTAIAFVTGGAFVDFAPIPTHTAHLPLAAFAVTMLIASHRPRTGAKGKLARLRIARPVLPAGEGRRTFWLGTVACCSGFAVAAIFLALGADIVVRVVDSPSALSAALVLALFPLATGVVPVIALRVPEHAAAIAGGLLAGVGILLLPSAATSDGLSSLAVAALVAGSGFGLLVRAGNALVLGSAEPAHRAGALSAMSLAMYLTQAAVALTAGVLADTWGLLPGIRAISPPVAVVIIVAVAVALLFDAKLSASLHTRQGRTS